MRGSEGRRRSSALDQVTGCNEIDNRSDIAHLNQEVSRIRGDLDTVALSGLHKLIKILVSKAKAHAKVEKKSCVLILKEDLVAADFVDSTVESQRRHR